ncbi:hypothetical protein [Paraburkholderia aspalathi]|uniref:Uncharacterized protein n=1 Tax=Paraburkholderia aspalathi TaxID=1324617 RepID=A0A1I7EGZ8_9BURK|nr:hypothetical protein [Paraburkholderia aspalathi]SFU23172.1 hypothetical protein SAMN05192563_102048 [Paraburkholderia aspalathi]
MSDNGYDWMTDARATAEERYAEDQAGRIAGWLTRPIWLIDDAIKLAWRVLDTDAPLPKFDFDEAMLYEEEGMEYDGVTPATLERVRLEARRDRMTDQSTPTEWIAFFKRHRYPGYKLFDRPVASSDVAPPAESVDGVSTATIASAFGGNLAGGKDREWLANTLADSKRRTNLRAARDERGKWDPVAVAGWLVKQGYTSRDTALKLIRSNFHHFFDRADHELPQSNSFFRP